VIVSTAFGPIQNQSMNSFGASSGNGMTVSRTSQSRNRFESLLDSVQSSPETNEIPKSFIDEKPNGTRSTREKLMDKAEKLEGVFLGLLMKQMRETVPDYGFTKRSKGEEMFQARLDKKYAQILAKRKDFGLAEEIFQQLSSQLTSSPGESERSNKYQASGHNPNTGSKTDQFTNFSP